MIPKESSQNQSLPSLSAPHVFQFEGWTVHEYSVVDSTNHVASQLPAWHAVRADQQTSGRGRFQRSWISDAGGLWLSAVIPTGPDTGAWSVLPLIVGVAVTQALRSLQVRQLRMRWPNDIMVNDLKMAGVLVDQFQPGQAVAGVGLNVFNQPQTIDPSLKSQVTRLADHLCPTPSLEDLVRQILASLRKFVVEMQQNGFQSLLPKVNDLWGSERRVELDLGEKKHSGWFEGVDEKGRLRLRDDKNQLAWFDSHQIIMLREI